MGRRTAGAVVVVLAAACGAGGFAALHRGGADSWTPVWQDDFSGKAGSLPDAGRWLVDTGTQYPGGAPAWGTGEQQVYTADPANVQQDGRGHLTITATRDESGGWRSGRIETRRDTFKPAEGQTLKVEARIRLPAGGRGYWAAFWMLGKDFRPSHTDWPAAGEMDILEHIGSEPSSAHGTFHCGTNPGGPCRETDGLSGTYTDPDGAELASTFHDYALQWDRSKPTEELRWYVDGHRYFTVKESQVPAPVWSRATKSGFFVLFNLAVGGQWPGPPDQSTKSGAQLVVDRVTISRR